jgi:phosphate ABC transporter permease subunit PstA
MSQTAPTMVAAPSRQPEDHPPVRSRRRKLRASPAAQGEPFVWLTGGALALALLMTGSLIGFILWSGLESFLPLPLVQVKTTTGQEYLGEIVASERFRPDADWLTKLDPAAKAAAERDLAATDGALLRRKFRTGNFDLSGTHFTWIDDCRIVADGETRPADAVLIERRDWGRFYGFTQAYFERTDRRPTDDERAWQAGLKLLDETRNATGDAWLETRKLFATGGPWATAESAAPLQTAFEQERAAASTAFLKSQSLPEGAVGEIVGGGGAAQPWNPAAPNSAPSATADVAAVVVRWNDLDAAWTRLQERLPGVQHVLDEKRHLEEVETGRLNDRENRALIQLRAAAMRHGLDVSLYLEALGHLREATDRQAASAAAAQKLAEVCARRFGADAAETKSVCAWSEAVGRDAAAATAKLEAASNNAAFIEKLPAEVRDHLAELRAVQAAVAAEYASLQARIDVLNQESHRNRWVLRTVEGTPKELTLADVVRTFHPNQLSTTAAIGVYASRWREFLFDEPRASNLEGGVYPAIVGTIVMTLFMSLAVVPFGVVAALYLREYAKPGLIVSAVRIAINNLAGVPSIVFGVFGLGFFCYFTGASIDQLFFPAESATSPVFGKGALIWASLTLALMTMPVVIVATEEALAAVANSMREGSYACGASKFQTIRRIVLPRALPGIMTGMILAMARGAGEVAPLMLVGALKNAPKLPIDGTFPLVHLDRSFMHLGFYIFDLGFQSPNSEAAKPMVFTTTLLLITIVVLLNVTAIAIRSRLRRRFQGTQF